MTMIEQKGITMRNTRHPLAPINPAARHAADKPHTFRTTVLVTSLALVGVLAFAGLIGSVFSTADATTDRRLPNVVSVPQAQPGASVIQPHQALVAHTSAGTAWGKTLVNPTDAYLAHLYAKQSAIQAEAIMSRLALEIPPRAKIMGSGDTYYAKYWAERTYTLLPLVDTELGNLGYPK